MPTFRFKGFRAASAVALSVGQGAVAASAEVAEWGQSSTGFLSIAVTSDAEKSATLAYVAPTSIWFDATPSGLGTEGVTLPPLDFASTPAESTTSIYDDHLHEVFYFWKVTRPAGASATYLPAGAVSHNIPTDWNNRNIAYGKLVAFCFDAPGSYTVECFAVGPNGTTAVRTITFQSGGDYPAIVDPDLAYAGAATICVNKAGDTDFSWAPDPVNNQKFWTGANDTAVINAALAAFNSDTNYRLLFKGGVEYDFTGTRTVDWQSANSTKLRFYIAGYGGIATISTGAQANQPETQYFSDLGSATLFNLHMKGNWSSLSQTGWPTSSETGAEGIRAGAATHYTIHKVRVTGYDINLLPPSFTQHYTSTGRGVLPRTLFSECLSTDWRRYCLFSNPAGGDEPLPPNQRPFLGVLGSELSTPTNALSSDTSGLHQTSGCWRHSYAGRVYVAANYMFLNGRYQPVSRFQNGGLHNSLGRKGWGELSVERCVFEGGDLGMGLGGSDPGVGDVYGAVPANIIADKVLNVTLPGHGKVTTHGPGSLPDGGIVWAPHTGPITIRNMAIVVPAGSIGTTGDIFENGDPTMRPRDTMALSGPRRYYNITYVLLSSSAQNDTRTVRWYDHAGVTKYPAFTFENNVLHVPNMSPPINAGPFTAATLAGFVPRYQGPNGAFAGFTSASLMGLNVPNNGTFTLPYSEIPTTTIDGRAATGPANQAYWQSNPTHRWHYFAPGRNVAGNVSGTIKYVASGQIEVQSYGATGITFVNRTGTSMTGDWTAWIDRRNLHPGPDTSQATPTNLNVSWIPTTGSPAIPSEDLGLHAVDDFLGRIRTVPRTRGAFQAPG